MRGFGVFALGLLTLVPGAFAGSEAVRPLLGIAGDLRCITPLGGAAPG